MTELLITNPYPNSYAQNSLQSSQANNSIELAQALILHPEKFDVHERAYLAAYIESKQQTPIPTAEHLAVLLDEEWLPVLGCAPLSVEAIKICASATFMTLTKITYESLRGALAAYLRGELRRGQGDLISHYGTFNAEFLINGIVTYRSTAHNNARKGKKIIDNEVLAIEYSKPLENAEPTREDACAALSELYAQFIVSNLRLVSTYPRYFDAGVKWKIITQPTAEVRISAYNAAVKALKSANPKEYAELQPFDTANPKPQPAATQRAKEMLLLEYFSELQANGHDPLEYFQNFTFAK